MERQFQSPRTFEGLELRGRSNLSPMPMRMPSLTKTQSSLLIDRTYGDSPDIFSTKSQNNDYRLERDFDDDISGRCKNSQQVFPFQNDDYGPERDVYVVFKVEGLPLQYDRKMPMKGRPCNSPCMQRQPSKEDFFKKTQDAVIRRKLSQSDMIVSGTKCSTGNKDVGFDREETFQGTRGGYPRPEPPSDNRGGYPRPEPPSDNRGGYPRPEPPSDNRGGYPRPAPPSDNRGGYGRMGQHDNRHFIPDMAGPIRIAEEDLMNRNSRGGSLQDVQNWNRRNDQRLVEDWSRQSNDHDKEIEKLTRELREANNIMCDIETNINSLKEEKEVSHHALLAIKADYRSLLEEKNICQAQITFIKKELNNYRIKDRRLVREFDQLTLCYGKLDHRERQMRRQISLLEAELSLVVSKLEAPKCTNNKPIVPRLDLNKLKPKKLPPVKNPIPGLNKIKELQQIYGVTPNAPRKLTEIIQVYDSKDSSRKMKRSMWPQHSLSSPMLGNGMAKTIPSGRGMAGEIFVPLVGNSFPLSNRPEKDSKSDNSTQYERIKLPAINEEHFVQKHNTSGPMQMSVSILSNRQPT